MKYEKSDRVQHWSYCCIHHMFLDVLETLLDEDSCYECVNIISDKYLTEKFIKLISQSNIDNFEFSFEVLDFNKLEDTVDEYRIIIFDDGSVYVESAIDKNAEYYDCDGFIFADYEVGEDAYGGNNEYCDVMVFDIENNYSV